MKRKGSEGHDQRRQGRKETMRGGSLGYKGGLQERVDREPEGRKEQREGREEGMEMRHKRNAFMEETEE